MIRPLLHAHIWTFLGAGILYGILYLFGISDLLLFSVYSYLTFYIIMILTLYVAYYTHNHPNKLVFGNAVLAMMILKLIASPFLVVWYINTHDEISRMILIPFFFAYLWFTAFELKYLLKKSKET